MSLFVVEPIEAANHRKLFTLFGVDYYATARAWLKPPLMAGAGIVVALIFAPAQQLSTQILIGFNGAASLFAVVASLLLIVLLFDVVTVKFCLHLPERLPKCNEIWPCLT